MWPYVRPARASEIACWACPSAVRAPGIGTRLLRAVLGNTRGAMRRTLCMFSTTASRLRTVPSSSNSTPKVSLSAIRELLKTHRLSYKDGHASFLVRCTFCEHGERGERTVYINKITGAAICDSCSMNGTSFTSNSSCTLTVHLCL